MEDEGSRNRAVGRLRQLRGVSFLEFPGTRFANILVEMNLSSFLDNLLLVFLVG